MRNGSTTSRAGSILPSAQRLRKATGRPSADSWPGSRWRRRATEARFLSRQRVDEPSTPGPSPEVIAFWGAVRALPARPRIAVTLYYAGDRTTAEVASILGVPEGTVRSDLSRARMALAKELEV